MRVSEIITRLSRDYQPDDELLIAWWDRETTNTYDEIGNCVEVPDAVWRVAVGLMDSGPGWGDYAYEAIHDYITDYVDHARQQIAEEVTA